MAIGVMHKPYILSSILVSVGGLLFGLDTGCIGPLTTMSQFTSYFGSFSSTVHGLLVSSILIPASLTSFFAGSVADSLGRTLTIAIGAMIFTLGTALEAAAQNLAMLFVGRCITGVGEGLFLSTLVVYVIEIAPARERGVLASAQQMLVTMGICAGYFVCYGTVRAGDSSLSWRLPFALQSFLACCYGVSVFLFLPQSPRWLKSKGRFEEAGAAWARLGIADAEKEKEDELQAQQQRQAGHDAAGPLQLQQQSPHGVLGHDKILEPESLALAPMRSHQSIPGAPAGSWLRVFRSDVRSRTLLGAFVMGMQQLSGIDGVLYYVSFFSLRISSLHPLAQFVRYPPPMLLFCSLIKTSQLKHLTPQPQQAPLLFQQAGLTSSQSSFLASGVSALLMMLITIPAFLYADKWGRRTSTLTGGLVLATTMLAIGTLYATHSVHSTHGAGRWAVVALIYIFALTFSVSWAVHVRIYSAEIQPVETRAPATSLAQTSNWCVNFLVALTTPIFLAHSSFGVYFLFGGASLLTVGVCAVLMPETRNKSLEEIEEAFVRHGRERGAKSRSFGEGMGRLTRRLRGTGRFVSSRTGIEEHEL